MTSDKQTEAIEQVDDEQVENVDEQATNDAETAQDDEQAQAIEQLSAKIATIDEQIEQYRVNAVEARKVNAMRKHGYDDAQIEKYARFIEGDTVEEIGRSIIQLSSDITPAIYYGDPNINNGVSAKPKTTDAEDLGRNAFQRIKHKIWR